MLLETHDVGRRGCRVKSSWNGRRSESELSHAKREGQVEALRRRADVERDAVQPAEAQKSQRQSDEPAWKSSHFLERIGILWMLPLSDAGP